MSVVNPTALYYHADEVLRPDFYGHEWRNAPDGPFVVYTTGSSAPYKGLVNLLEAVGLLSRILGARGPSTGQWADPGHKHVADRPARHGSSGPRERYRLARATVGLSAIVSELKAASIYVHPSLVDNSPNALAEAMMLGVPCVASSAGGVPSMITDGVDGLLHGSQRCVRSCRQDRGIRIGRRVGRSTGRECALSSSAET